MIATCNDERSESSDKFNTWSDFPPWVKKPVIIISVVISDIIVATWVDISVLVWLGDYFYRTILQMALDEYYSKIENRIGDDV